MAALGDLGKLAAIHVYDGADHGFFCDQRETYHEASAKDAFSLRKP